MKENFLHYVWQFQYFDKQKLETTCNQPILVVHPGFHNQQHAGPDFEQGKVKIGALNWVGQVEIHYRSSDWIRHQHQHDLAYDNVILHVVWVDDLTIYRSDGTRIPTLALKDRVDRGLIAKFKKLVDSSSQIACKESFSNMDALVKLLMLDKAVMQRLERKTLEILELLKINQMDWEETAYQAMAKSFGFKVNAFPFLLLARNLPVKLLKKHADQLFQLEALLFGQSGLLGKVIDSDDYHQAMSREYAFLAHKYRLLPTQLAESQWKFLRMRPANFPTIRLAQFASLHFKQQGFFSKLLMANDVKELEELLSIQQSTYWRVHYLFGKESKKAIAGLGQQSIQNLMINAVIPILMAYGKHKSEQLYVEKAIELLSNIRAEKNQITAIWKDVGLTLSSAFDSQGAIEWYQEYCTQHQCLRCGIGVKLVR